MNYTATYLILLSLLSVVTVYAQAPQKISATEGDTRGRPTPHEAGDFGAFGSRAYSPLGDFDGDGTPDLLVSLEGDDEAGPDAGAFLILLLNPDGSIKDYHKVTSATPVTGFGEDGTSVDDLDGNGTPDLIVLSIGPDAWWLVLMKADGMIKQQQQICSAGSDSGMDGCPPATRMGDVDDDGTVDLGVCRTPGNLNLDVGESWVVFLNGSGTIRDVVRSPGPGGAESDFAAIDRQVWADLNGDGVPEMAVFEIEGMPPFYIQFLSRSGRVVNRQQFDIAEGEGIMAGPGDLDGDGIPELAVGAPGIDDGGEGFNPDLGAVYILFLNEDGTVKHHQKISQTQGGFTGTLSFRGSFGSSLVAVGDVNGDGIPDLAVGAARDDEGWERHGAVWILFLNRDGTVQGHYKITLPRFVFLLDDDDHFGSAASLGEDLDGDGTPELFAGVPGDDDGGTNRGAVYLLSLNADGTTSRHRKISATDGGFSSALSDDDAFGSALAVLNDLDGDGTSDLAVGAPGTNSRRGVVYTLQLTPDGRVQAQHQITMEAADVGDQFGRSLVRTGNFELLAGAPGTDSGHGTVYALQLQTDGSMESIRWIPVSGIVPGDSLGTSVASLGDLDGDGIGDLVFGAPGTNGRRGAAYLLLMEADGSVRMQRPIAPDALQDGDAFGTAVAGPGDLDGDGTPDLLVGAPGNDTGIVYIFLLNPDGTIRARATLTNDEGLDGLLRDQDGFGSALAGLGDLDGDGLLDLLVGAPGDDDGCDPIGDPDCNHGAVYTLSRLPGTSPVVAMPEVISAPVATGQDAAVEVSATDINPLDAVTFSFRRAGDETFFSAPMSVQGDDRYRFTIPAFAVSERGVEYFITATNVNARTTRMPEHGIHALPIHVPGGLTRPVEAGIAASAYRLFSVPLDLENKSLQDLLEASMGPSNPKQWRAYWFEADQGLLRDVAETDVDLEPGQAFWLLAKEAGKVLSTGAGTSTTTASSYGVALFEGWNLVGNPFAFEVPPSRLQTQSGDPVDLRRYDGAWSGVDSLIQPFEGYAIFSNQAFGDTLWFEPSVSFTLGKRAVPPVASKQADAPSWSIAIHAHAGLARDIDNRAAVITHATDGFDAFDRPEPPVIGDYVSVAFPHEDWQRTATRYSTDARPPTEGETTWMFEVRTHQPERVELSFEGLADVPIGYGVWLIDDLVGVRQNLRAQPRYAVGTGGMVAEGRRLKLVVAPATEREGSVPQQFELSQNFPNPFNPSTTLRYGVPEASQVRVAVYDVLGRQVAVLVEGEASAGHHVVVWDGRSDAGASVGSGLYLARMEAGSFTKTRTMMMVK